jgi:hypothetical protein
MNCGTVSISRITYAESMCHNPSLLLPSWSKLRYLTVIPARGEPIAASSDQRPRPNRGPNLIMANYRGNKIRAYPNTNRVVR